MVGPSQLQTDVDFLTSQPGWQDRDGRRDYIRNVAAKSLQDETMDPAHHAAVIGELWKRSDDRGMLKKAADFVADTGKEVGKGLLGTGMAASVALNDAFGDTDTGSGTRLKRGVAEFADGAVQLVKSFHPNDKAEQRDFALGELKKDLDARNYPEGLEAWLAGSYDVSEAKPDEETNAWIDALGWGLGRKAVAADHSGEVDKEVLAKWIQSDRNPWRKDSDTEGPGPRALLADYVVTRDPSSWEAFAARVKETDAEHTTRLQRWAKEGKLREGMKRFEEGSVGKALAETAVSFQGSPIDLVASVLPFLQGARAFRAAKAGSRAGAAAAASKAIALEGGSEALTEAIMEPGAPTSQIMQAGAMGALGGAMVGGVGAAAGEVANRLVAPQPVITPEIPAAAATEVAPASVGAPLSPASADAGGVQGSPQSAPVIPTEVAAEPAIPRSLAAIAADAGRSEVVSPSDAPTIAASEAPTVLLSREPAGEAGTVPPGPPESSATSSVGEATPEAGGAQLRGRRPVIPNSPLGDYDLLDYLNENPIALPRKGTTGMAGEYDWRETMDIPNYYRQFIVGRGGGGMQIDVLAQAAFEEGFIREPSVDVLMNEVQSVIKKRQQYPVMMRSQEKAQKDQEKRATAYDRAEANAKLSVPLHRVATGDTFELGGEKVRVKDVRYDEDGYLESVTIEDGRKFGVLTFDAQSREALLVDEWKPKKRTKSEDDPFALEEPQKGVNVSVREPKGMNLAMIKRFRDDPRFRDDLSARRGGTEGGFVALPDLSALTRAVTTGTPAMQGQRSAVYYQGQGPFRVQNPGLRAVLRGGLLPKELTTALTQSEHERAALNQSAARISGDLDKTINEYAKRTGAPLQVAYDLVNAALEDPVKLAGILDPGLKEATWRARNFIDQLSDSVATILGPGSNDVILDNMGSWMRRSYAAFDPNSGWSLDGLEAAAKKGKSIAGKPARRILDDARRYLQAQNPGATPEKITALMKDLTDRDAWSAALTGDSSKVSKDVTSLMKRKDIAPEIRALMGEEINPIKRIGKSAGFQAQFIARHEMQRNMREIGLKLGLFSKEKAGNYNVRVGGEGGPLSGRWSGFGLLYTTPEMMNALQNARGVVTGTDMGGILLNFFKFYGSESKMAQVALNYKSLIPNALGNVWGMVATGDAFLPRHWHNMGEAARIMRSVKARSGSAINTAAGIMQDQRREMLARLRASGVASGGLDMQDIEANLDNSVLQFIEQSNTANRAAGAARGALVGQSLGSAVAGETLGRPIGAAAGGVAGAALGNKRIVGAYRKIAEWALSKPDNFAKISTFLTNYETALAAGLTTQDAYTMATERTLNTLPDYSKLHPAFKELSRLGMLGSFIGFQHEVYRNLGWNVRYAKQDLLSGNPTLMAAGARRLFGTALALSMNKMVIGAALGLVGMGFDPKDEDKAAAYRRALARPWDRFSELHFDELTGERARYMNTSYLIPQATIWEVIRAGWEGRNDDKMLENIADQFADQFVNGSVHADPLLEAILNRRKFGPAVTPNKGLRGLADRVAHVMQAPTPATVKSVGNIIRAEMGRSRGDVEFSTENELLGVLGLRLQTRTHDLGMKDHLYEFADRMKTAREIAEREWRNYGKHKTDTIGRMEQENGVTRANEEIANITRDWTQWKADLATLGISDSRVKRVMKERGITVNPKPLKLGRDGPETVK